LHGHEGYMDGPVAWVVKDAIATRIAGGTSEMQKVNIFNQIWKLQPEELYQ
ncbi:MAG: acyl-CoA dehydrogenase family protein, partial [Candidatus Tectomicrobia bacterium]